MEVMNVMNIMTFHHTGDFDNEFIGLDRHMSKDIYFDIERLKNILIAAGLDSTQPNDMRLLANELSKPRTSIAEAAKRAGERKTRRAQGSLFDLLNSYFKAFN